MPPDQAPFAHLDEQALRGLAPGGAVRSYPRNVVVVSEGDPTDSLYVVLSGRVKVFVADENGRELVVNTIRTGDYFGGLVVDGGARGFRHDARGVAFFRDSAARRRRAALRQPSVRAAPGAQAHRQGALSHRAGPDPRAGGRLSPLGALPRGEGRGGRRQAHCARAPHAARHRCADRRLPGNGEAPPGPTFTR